MILGKGSKLEKDVSYEPYESIFGDSSEAQNN